MLYFTQNLDLIKQNNGMQVNLVFKENLAINSFLMNYF